VRKPSAFPKSLAQAFRAGYSLAGAVHNMRFLDWKTIGGNLEIIRNSQVALVPFRAELRFAKPRAPRKRFAI
jgi:hypothetical protein